MYEASKRTHYLPSNLVFQSSIFKPAAWSRCLSLVAVLVLAIAQAEAQTVTISWDPNGEPDLAGYIIGYGTAPGQNDHLVDVGLATQWKLGGFSSGLTYYFRIYAYNAAGLRSAPSAEVSAAFESTASGGSSCLGGPPVAGWICLNGGWVPPDSPLLAPTSSTPSPGTTLAGSQNCPGAAPAAGWICQSGNWLPPDSPLLLTATKLQTGSAAPPTCPGSPPGVGWVCQSGNWLPPDSPLLFTTPSVPSSPAPAACPGAPPGVGWVCLSGNWLPPDHPLVKVG